MNSAILSKVFNNTITQSEALAWSDERGHNLWHILASGKEDEAFFNLCNKVSKNDLEKKLLEQNESGDTPLHVATWLNAVNVVKFLSHEKGIKINEVLDAKKRIIAFIATEMNHNEILNLCFESGINLEHRDKNGNNLAYFATNYNNTHCIELLAGYQHQMNLERNAFTSVEHSDEIIHFFKDNKANLRGNYK